MRIVPNEHYTQLQECEAAVPIPESIHWKNIRQTYNRPLQGETARGGEGDKEGTDGSSDAWLSQRRAIPK